MKTPIITSLLDTDQYVLTMAQAALHQASGSMVKWKFKCRNGTALPLNYQHHEFIRKLQDQIDHLCSLTFSEDELKYLSSLKYFKSDFIDMLRLLKLNSNHIDISIDKNNGLAIEIEGPVFLTCWFEVPVLAIVSELYNDCEFSTTDCLPKGRNILRNKINFLKDNLSLATPFKFIDFGTRRRFCFQWHEEVILTLLNEVKRWFVGTSNLYFAKNYNIKPIGTHSHWWFQMFQRMGFQLAKSQTAALDAWQREYRGDLGIALSDIGGFNWFLNDFDLFYAKLFDGCRHDSGDPFEWIEKLISHYEKLEIDPKTRTAVFSDGLNFKVAIELFFKFSQRINTSFGIGTWLTNDMGWEALQIVIKMIECNGGPVSKKSDSIGKGMCEDLEFDDYFGKVIREEIKNGS